MLNLDPAKLLLIGIVAAIVLGPERMPQVARRAGALWRSLNEARWRVESHIGASIPDLPIAGELRLLSRSPTILLDRLSAPHRPQSGADDPGGSTPPALPSPPNPHTVAGGGGLAPYDPALN